MHTHTLVRRVRPGVGEDHSYMYHLTSLMHNHYHVYLFRKGAILSNRAFPKLWTTSLRIPKSPLKLIKYLPEKKSSNMLYFRPFINSNRIFNIITLVPNSFRRRSHTVAFDTLCWQEPAGTGLGYIWDASFSMWQWLRLYSEICLSTCLVSFGSMGFPVSTQRFFALSHIFDYSQGTTRIF